METNSNFGFNLSDRIFGTYLAQPKDGHLGMTIGLRQFRNTAEVTLPRLLIMPFTSKQGKYALGRQGT